MSRPGEWWPLADADPVPGDPQPLAVLGRRMAGVADAIERMARQLPGICGSEVWDSDAGQQFRQRAARTAAGIGRTHRRFFIVAAVLGRDPYSGTGYAAQLRQHQQAADDAVNAVNGTAARPGSEAERRNAWRLLLAETGGADPARPPAARGTAPVPAGPMPQPRPGVIPEELPAFPADPARVAALKQTYNAAIGQLRSSAHAITAAAAARSADAQAAARQIQAVIGHDGLNNPSGFLHWVEHAADDVGHFVAAHWAGFVAALANVAGVIATACGILAMVFAFIPGMQEFAALFETVALLAQAVALVCHVALLATGHGSWLDIALDTVGLVTFGIGKGLIGGAEATAKVSEAAAAAYRTEAAGDSVDSIIAAGDKAAEKLAGADNWTLTSKMLEQLKATTSVRPVMGAAAKAWQAGKLGTALGGNAAGALTRGFRSALGMGSPEIAEAMSSAAQAGHDMTAASGVAWAMSSRIESYGQLFRLTQGTGVGTDLVSKLDQGLHAAGLGLPGYDNLSTAMGPGGG